MEKCPCLSGAAYEQCCGQYHSGKKKAPTAEALMRARYSAYAKGQIDFVANTHATGSENDFDMEAARRWAAESEWLGLEVIKVKQGQEKDDQGVVEFVAHYKAQGTACNHHEVAEFIKEKGEWRYDKGAVMGRDPVRRQEPKVGRNDPCPCGSGKKFKKCCGSN